MNKLLQTLRTVRADFQKRRRLRKFSEGGNIPWSVGYDDFRWKEISAALSDESLLTGMREHRLRSGYGKGIDERIVEYPWAFSLLSDTGGKLLDAGSTFNFREIVSHDLLKKKELSIYTFFPETWNFVHQRISYQFGDLRELPYRDFWFDEIVCISTIEHIGQDNTLYGYQEANEGSETEEREYLPAVKEMVRVLKRGGKLLLTFPFGKHIRYGYFQQFNSIMVQRILEILAGLGHASAVFFRYTQEGWIFSDEKDCEDCEAYNPHTGQGKGTDGAAHSRSVCSIQFIKA
jgi:SAM-dependent methyltransferase